MLGALSPQQALFFLILIVAFGLLITEKLRNDAVAILIIIALTASGLLSSAEALAGFGSEPAIAVAAIFVLSQALHQTGLSQLAGEWIARASGTSYTRIVGVIMLAVAAMSAFTHHVTTTAVMLPVSMTLARDCETSPSKLLKPISEIEAGEGHRELFVTGWLRHGRQVRAPYGDQVVRSGDVLMVRTSPEQMVAITERAGVELHPITQYGTAADDGAGADDEAGIADKLVQAIVAPASELAGRTLGDVNFHDRYGAIVVGLWRRSGWLNEELSRIRLEAGDVLVLQGDDESLNRVANDRAFLMLMPFQGEARPRRKAPLAALIMVATVLVAASSVLPLPVAMMAGACAMVLTGCLRPRQAYRAIDARIYVFIAGAIPLGDAMEKSGASKLMATWIQGTLGGLNETVVLLVIFGIVAVLTQFMSDAATVALFGPVASALAHGLGRNPEAFVVTVAMAAVVAFITPIGHHGNLLIYGPGRYQFADFVRVGTPLTILIGIVVGVTTQLVWPG